MHQPRALDDAQDLNLLHLRARASNHVISHGDTALVMDSDGTIALPGDAGLYVNETRMLSRHRIRANGRPLLPVTLGAPRQDQWHGYYLLVPDSRTMASQETKAAAATDSIELHLVRSLGEGMHEDLSLTNYSPRTRRVRLAIELDADFAGIDETQQPPKRGRVRTRSETRDDALLVHWDFRARHTRRGGGTRRIHRSLTLRVTPAEDVDFTDGVLSFDVRLEPQQHWRACLQWQTCVDGEVLPCPPCALQSNGEKTKEWLARATRMEAASLDMPGIGLVLERGRRDLHALRLPRYDEGDDAWVVAAGAPNYLALFGRDVLTVGWQALPLGPEPLRGALQVLAKLQGTRDDDWRDEQPGRILHEARVDPAATLQQRPHGRYYGSLTSAALFPLSVAELWLWTVDRERVGALIDPALRALRWLDENAQQVPGPFYAVATRSPQGLDNQTWKDSSESIVDPDGKVVDQPVATCEEQGIVYASKRRFAQVLAAFGRDDEARALRQQAQRLRERFHRHYWLDRAGFVAMALDPRGKPVESVGSNGLRCVGSGILDDDMAAKMAERAFADDMFTGWGIRTLSSEHPAYNPYGYHRGTVWPVEHGPFALGLRRHGLDAHCERLCKAQFELACLCAGHRLPECVVGHPRDALHPFPAVYPAANSPQAWSATTPIALVQALLGLQAFAPQRQLWLDPVLPEWLPELRLSGLRVGDAVLDLHVRRAESGESEFEVKRADGDIEVLRQTMSWDADDA